jgi:diaminopimelate decarboxylase
MTAEELLKIANTHECPLYVYDSNKIIDQYHKLTDSFSKIRHLKIKYAVKALSNLHILKLIEKLGGGLDTVSIEEIKLGLMADFDPKEIIFTPNGVSFSELEEAASLGVQINIDNLSMLEEFGSKYPLHPVCIRINPHVMAGGNPNISVGHIDSKFGISVHQIPHIKTIVENTGMIINGIHMHTGSDILDVDVFLEATEILFNTVYELYGSCFNLEFIDFGSGFKVPYRDGDIETNIEELGQKMSNRFNGYCEKWRRNVALYFEPGKFLVSEAGYFLVKVNSVKQTTSTVFACIDSGFNHLIRPMFYNAHHDIINLSNPAGKERFYTVVGYICETDTFATNVKIPEINEGDILCFKNAGAYCYSMSNNYNSRLKPAEVLWDGINSKLIRRRETINDLIKTQVSLDETIQ